VGEQEKEKSHIPTRLNILFLLVFLFFAAIILRLAYVQLVEGEQYMHDLEKYSTRELSIPAPRGRIVDRNGEVLVDNKPVFTVTYVKEQGQDIDEEQLADKLAQILKMDDVEPGTDSELLKKVVELHATLPVSFKPDETNALIAKIAPKLSSLPKVDQVDQFSDPVLAKAAIQTGMRVNASLDKATQDKLIKQLKPLVKPVLTDEKWNNMSNADLLKYAVANNLSFSLSFADDDRKNLRKNLKEELRLLPDAADLPKQDDMELLRLASRFDIEVKLPFNDAQRQYQWRKMAILNEIRSYGIASYIPRRIKVNITPEEDAKIEERLSELPGISVISEPIRQIRPDPDGTPFATHILGYTNTISESRLNEYLAQGYKQTDRVGVSGLEGYYERQLRGKDGAMEVQINKNSQMVEKSLKRPAEPGNDLVLALDWRFQSAVEAALKQKVEEMKKDPKVPKEATEAHAVVMDVNTGGVLAMASYPDYDLNLHYDRKAFNENYDTLIRNVEENKLIRGAWPPGSTAKPLSVMLSLQEGLVTPNETIYDPGYWIVGRDTKKYNWRRSGHGYVNARRALQVSNNTYMYAMAMRLADVGYKKYGSYKPMFSVVDFYNAQFGLGVTTGIDLPGELTGWFSQYQEIGNLADAFIGQYNSFTPMQLAQYAATIANGGYRLRPHLVEEIREGTVDPKQPGRVLSTIEPEVLNRVNVDPKWIKLVQEGMFMVTQGDGTASRTFAGLPFHVAAKTGTAQTGTGADNAIMIGFAPYENPQIAFAVVVPKSLRDGFHSADTSGAIARKILEAYQSFYMEKQPAK
jgi:cell division protein FtsI/penicillin-binding protein 2